MYNDGIKANFKAKDFEVKCKMQDICQMRCRTFQHFPLIFHRFFSSGKVGRPSVFVHEEVINIQQSLLIEAHETIPRYQT